MRATYGGLQLCYDLSNASNRPKLSLQAQTNDCTNAGDLKLKQRLSRNKNKFRNGALEI